MSGKSRQSGDPAISIRKMYHTRIRNLITNAPETLVELRRLLAKSPNLAAAYRFVQRVYGAHDKRHLTPSKGRKRVLKAWAALPEEVKRHFPKFKTALFVRGEEYANIWARGATTNGVTEAMNRAIRDIQRSGRGLSFEETRLRAIYGASPTKRILNAKSGLPDPIEQARAIIRGEKLPDQVRTVSRHDLHRRGKRQWKRSPKQMDMFPDWT